MTARYLVSGRPISDYYPTDTGRGPKPDTRVWEYVASCGDSYVNIGPLPLYTKVWCSKHP